jgi:hypothetical protein
MPTTYIPKTQYLAQTKIQKLAKRLIEEADEDRSLALEAYRYFKQRVEENPADNVSKQQMVDCLKVAQSSKQNTIKVIALMTKFINNNDEPEKTKASGKTESLFEDLDNSLND